VNLIKQDAEETYGDWECSSMHFLSHDQPHYTVCSPNAVLSGKNLVVSVGRRLGGPQTVFTL